MSQLIGRYQPLDRIGIGGMAEVFRARMVGAGDFSRMVVVKRMIPQLAADSDAVMMFLDEARLGSKLHHPNIVSVLDLGERNGDYFMVMEYVDGVDLGTLDSRARGRGERFPVEHAAWIVARAAEGLGAAHDARDPATGRPLEIVHRDVSPSNILISRSAEVKVADFGVARSSAQQVRTSTGVLKGKIPYMSPEQLLGEELDARSDVYALGVVLWQLLTGRKRHDGRNDLKIIQSVVQEETPRPGTVRPGLDPALEEIVMAMCERRRENRLPTAWQAAQLLDHWLSARTHTSRQVAQWVASVIDAPAPARSGPKSDWPALTVPPSSDVASITERSPMYGAPVLSEPRQAEPRQAEHGNPEPFEAVEAPVIDGPSAVQTFCERSQWQQLRDQRIVQAPDTQTRMSNEVAVVIVPSRKLMHSLNGTATFIWERADGHHTLAQIADAMIATFDVEEDVAREEVLAFVFAAIEGDMLLLA